MKGKVCINLTGQAGAGKTTVATYLSQKYGFYLFRPSDMVRAYAQQNAIILTCREDYIACHRRMYAADPQVMTKPIKESECPRVCVDGLRAPLEIAYLQRHCGMLTLALQCPANIRFKRIQAEGASRRRRDASRILTFPSFIADEQADNIAADPRDPNVQTAMGMADFFLDTNIDKQTLLARIDALLASLDIQ